MSSLLSENNKKMLASYARSCVAAGLAVYMTGNTNPKDIATAAFAGLVPVIMLCWHQFFTRNWLPFAAIKFG